MATIKVRSGLKGNRVAFWERHDSHPGGEVFVAGKDVVEVAETRKVMAAISRSKLVKVDSVASPKKAATQKDAATGKKKPVEVSTTEFTDEQVAEYLSGNVPEVIERIETQENVHLLNAALAAATRKTVVDAIIKRLEELKG